MAGRYFDVIYLKESPSGFILDYSVVRGLGQREGRHPRRAQKCNICHGDAHWINCALLFTSDKTTVTAFPEKDVFLNEYLMELVVMMT